MTIIGSRPMIFSSLFHEGTFSVPWHQRRYDWKKEHTSDLLRDIDEAITEQRKCYFLGSIMLVKHDDRMWEINDGQQRMVTFSLICARLCRLFNQHNTTPSPSVHETLALRILFDLGEHSTDTLSKAGEFTPRLTPPRDDLSRYHLIIRGRNIGTNGKLTAAWQEIDNFVSAMDRPKAEKFFEFMTQKIEVACLDIPKDIDPNSVYETINCRGKPLEDFDLMRNHFYSYFNRDEERNRRDTVHNNLENARTQIRDAGKAADYVRCYFQCRYGFLPKDRLYREVRRNIGINTDGPIAKKSKPADYVYDLVEELTRSEWVEVFRKISNPRTADAFIETFVTHSKSIHSKRNLSVFLRELQAYKVVQPMIFALLVRYVSEADTTKKRSLAKPVHACIKNITSFVMRTAFVAPKFEPSHFESEFADLAKRIMSVDSLSASFNMRVMEQLRVCDTHYGIIEDSKFIDAIANMEIHDRKKSKRFLFGLNADMQTDGDIINEQACTIEHILPKSNTHWSGWSGFRGHDPAEWVHRIGNQTIIGGSDNKPGRRNNGDFSRKKPLLERSALAITKKIAKSHDWSPDEIIKRQKEMAKQAATVWAFSK